MYNFQQFTLCPPLFALSKVQCLLISKQNAYLTKVTLCTNFNSDPEYQKVQNCDNVHFLSSLHSLTLSPLTQELHSGSCQHVQLPSGDSLRKHLWEQPCSVCLYRPPVQSIRRRALRHHIWMQQQFCDAGSIQLHHSELHLLQQQC